MQNHHHHFHWHRGGPPQGAWCGAQWLPAHPAHLLRPCPAGHPHYRATDEGHGGHGHGGRGGPHGHGAGHGGRGGGRQGGGGRPLGRGDLRLLLLAQIEQQPRHGYELIRLIGELFNDAYVPSPGVVYPTLALLEDLGWIAAEPEGGRKRYHITDAGRAQVDAERATIDAVQARTHIAANRLAKASLPAPVREAMQALKHTLLQHQDHWDDDEAQRVAGLLARASAAIEAGRA